MHGFYVDDVLKEFDLENELKNEEGNYYNPVVTRDRYLRLSYHLSVYFFRKKDFKEGLEKTLYTLKYAIYLKSHNYFVKIVPLFERFRSFATDEQIMEYEKLLRRVLKNEEMDYGINSGY